MKKFFIYALIGSISISLAHAQLDRSKYPAAGPSPEIHIAEADSFTLPNGLKVFVVENHKLPRVNFSLVIDRTPLLEGDKAGLTSLFGDMLTRGTTTRSKDQIDEALDMIGAQVSASSNSLTGSSLKKYCTKMLDVYVDMLLHPSFVPEELAKVKPQTLSALKSDENSPDAISKKVVNILNYGKDHPFGEFETEASIQNVQTHDLMNYYKKYFIPNSAYLAIVGDITKAEAETLVKNYFSTWQKGEVIKSDLNIPQPPAGNRVVLVNRLNSAQSVVTVTYPVILPNNDPNVVSLQLLNNILGGGSSGRLFQSLREKRGYTYGAYSTISPNRYIGSFSASANVRTSVADSAARLFLEELSDIRDLKAEELTASKAVIAGSFARSLENPATIANFAINTDILGLPKNYYRDYLKNLDAVTVAQLKSLAPKYMRPEQAYIVIVGNTDGLEEKLSDVGEVVHYSTTGLLLY